MPLKFADRVREWTMSVGTGPLVLAGVPNDDYRRWSDPLSPGDSAPGLVIAQGKGEWVVALLTMLEDGRLSVGTPTSSSNGGAPVSFSPGRKEVILAARASDIFEAINAVAGADAAREAAETARDVAEGFAAAAELLAANVTATVADAAPPFTTWAALGTWFAASSNLDPAVYLRPVGSIAPADAEGHLYGQYRNIAGTLTWESDTLLGVDARAAGLAQRVDRLDPDRGPRVGSYRAMTFNDTGNVSAREGPSGPELAISSGMVPLAPTLDSLVRRADAAIGQLVPRVGSNKEMEFDADGKVISVTDAAGTKRQAIGTGLSTTPEAIVDLRTIAGSRAPRVGSLAEGAFDANTGALLHGWTVDGQPVYRDPFRNLKTGIQSNTVARVQFKQNATYGWSAPPNIIDLILVTYGQSYNSGHAENYAAATTYNTSAITGVWMPSVGVHPNGAPFDTLVPARSLFNPASPLDEQEPPALQMGRRVAEGFAAAGIDGCRIIVVGHSHGGQKLQVLMPGSADWEILMDGVARGADASRRAGRIPIVVCFNYNQGENNRTGTFLASPEEWATFMPMLQKRAEAQLRAITGQIEPIPLITHAITRTGRPCGPALGVGLAALRNPQSVIVANPHYCLPHGSDTHPLVLGNQMIGDFVGQAFLDRVLGFSARMFHPLLPRIVGPRKLLLTFNLPLDAALELDTSNSIIKLSGLGNGAGWEYWHVDPTTGPARLVPSSTTVSSNIHPADGGYGLEVTFPVDVNWGSLIGDYASTSDYSGGGLGGPIDGPRGIVRSSIGRTVSSLGVTLYPYLLPWRIS